MDTDFSESPIKRLEKRIASMESNGFNFNTNKFLDDTTQILKGNQSIINDVLRSNNDLRGDIESLSGKMDTFLTSMNEFLGLLKLASQENADPADNLTKKLSEAADHNKNIMQLNQSMLTTLELIEKRLKRQTAEDKPQQQDELKEKVQKFY